MTRSIESHLRQLIFLCVGLCYVALPWESLDLCIALDYSKNIGLVVYYLMLLMVNYNG